MDKDLELIESGNGLSKSSTTTKETGSGTKTVQNDKKITGTRITGTKISQYTFNGEKSNKSGK